MANIKDFATALILTAPSPATSGTSLVLASGMGARMPAVPFNAVAHPDGQLPTLDNAERVLVTARSTDTLTITRAQGGTTAQSIAAGWRFSNTIVTDDILNASTVTDELITGTVNGSNAVFTTGSNFSGIQVYKNGVAMHLTDDFTITGANQVTFVTAPATGTKLTASYIIGSQTMINGSNSTILDETPAGTVNGSNTTFTTARAYIAGSLQVFINGVKQKRTTHFTETTPASGIFTMGDAPLTGDDIMVNYHYVQSVYGNADTLDGYHANATPTANTLLPLDANGKLTPSTFPVQQTWQAPSLQNGWVNYDSGFETVGYMKDSLGFVHIKGFIKSGNTAAATLLFTLPAGYRPGAATYLVSGFGSGNSLNAWELQADGDVLVQQANATYSSLGHIVFKAEA